MTYASFMDKYALKKKVMRMELQKLRIIFSIILLADVSFHSRLVIAQEVEDESEFSYVEGKENGPGEWGKLHKEWEACSNGKLQSPIDLTDKRVEVSHQLGRIRRQYRPAKATMVNRGHDIMVKWEDGAGGMWLNNGTTEYILKQLHWHSPSEHTVNGKSFDLELHMVHQASNGEIAVIGILYNLGRPDSFLAELEGYIHELADIKHHEEEDLGIVNPRRIKTGGRMYYRYLGSLTTPPCTEGVIWTVAYKPRTASKEQLELLRHAVEDGHEKNARPVQETNGRTLHFYLPFLKKY